MIQRKKKNLERQIATAKREIDDIKGRRALSALNRRHETWNVASRPSPPKEIKTFREQELQSIIALHLWRFKTPIFIIICI